MSFFPLVAVQFPIPLIWILRYFYVGPANLFGLLMRNALGGGDNTAFYYLISIVFWLIIGGLFGYILFISRNGRKGLNSIGFGVGAFIITVLAQCAISCAFIYITIPIYNRFFY